MSEWSSGYVADINYTYGYYSELNPSRLALTFLNAGLKVPDVVNACELGFGQGLSANIHASASAVQWYGTDFNPSQAFFAQELAHASGNGAKLFDEAFADFSNRNDLPDFDYIALHGIWSWISDENRSVIIDFVRRKLKVGGVLYISYNTLPGWSIFAPMRHLMTEHAEVLSAEGKGIISRIDGAIDFAEKLLALNPLFNRANPLVSDRLKKMKEHSRHYLAHEYFNRDWHPMYFSDMAALLEPAKLQYACSAHLLDTIDTINLTAEQQAFLNEIPDPVFKESVRDYMVNQQFRRDYWVKGARRLSQLEYAEAIRSVSVMLIAHHKDVTLKVNGSLGEANMSEAVYNPIIEHLSDYKHKTIGQIEQAVKPKNIGFAQIMQAMFILSGKGYIAAVQPNDVIMKAKKSTDRLNTYIIRKARGSSDIVYLASPVTGGGVNVGRFAQLFILAMQQGKKQPEEWAQFVLQILTAQGQKIVKEGKTLETSEENMSELVTQAQNFAVKQLPVLKALMIA